MGNGQNRNRRGGARHGGRRGGAGANDRRGATHLMPPTYDVAPEQAQMPTAAEAQSGADPTPDQAQAAEMAEEQFERQAGELRDATPQARAETEPGIEVASSDQPAQMTPVSEATARPLAVESSAPAEPPESREAEASAEPERRATRGRFYAPGQGPRAEHNGHNGHNGHAANGAARRPPREPLSAYAPSLSPSAQAAEDDDEGEAPYSSPREDVRGPVGELIDALHDLFTRDRVIASQGAASRCGICYFHYPLGELVYREAEGFYVCQACERALGGSRVPMARRQQRL